MTRNRLPFRIPACLGFRFVLGLAMSAVMLFAEQAAAQVAPPRIENFDIRHDDDAMRRRCDEAIDVKFIASRTAAAARLSREVNGVRISFDPILGTPKFVRSTRRLLTDAPGVLNGQSEQVGQSDPASWLLIIRDYIDEFGDLFGVGGDALDQCRISRNYVTAANGVRSITLQQQVAEDPSGKTDLIGAELRANFDAAGRLINIASTLVPAKPTPSAAGAKPLGASEALAIAMNNMGIVSGDPQQPIGEISSPRSSRVAEFSPSPALGMPARAHWVYFPITRDEARPAWEVTVAEPGLRNVCAIVIDALDGRVLARHNMVHDAGDQPVSYRVFTDTSPTPMLPGLDAPGTAQPPQVARELITLVSLDPVASPAGWINDGDNTTAGNNAVVRADANADNIPDEPPTTGDPFRVFDFPADLSMEPSAYRDASIVNTFYWMNALHDRLYGLGWDEAAGNCQVDNFGRGGAGADPMRVDAQDGQSTDNNFIFVPPDGISPIMTLLLLSGPSPNRDGGLDQIILAHEYAHALSTRLGGDFRQRQSAGLGEGWSDFYALALFSRPEDDPRGNYPLAPYSSYLFLGLAENYYFGIRRYPYSTSMEISPLTFADMDPLQFDLPPGVPSSPIHDLSDTRFITESHNIGEIWTLALWEARAFLIESKGFAGNEIMLRLVTDGLKLVPAEPDYIMARDAVLQADLVGNGGENLCDLWRGFARRGLGASASSPGTITTTGVVEAFDLPEDICVFSRGEVVFESPAYACEATAVVKVRDRDLQGAPGVAVTLTSSTGSTMEITLVESTPDSGIFRATVPLTADAAAPSLALRVEDGGTIDAAYADLDDGTGNPAIVTSSAAIDCTASGILDVISTPVGLDGIRVTFTTDEAATASVHLSVSCGATDVVLSTTEGTSHEVFFTGLDPCTPYFFTIYARDTVGNVSRATNDGTCFQTTTAVEMTIFADDFEGSDMGWTHAKLSGLDVVEDLWGISEVRAAGGQRSFHSGEAPPGFGSTALTSPVIELPLFVDGIRMSFVHFYDFEPCRPFLGPPDGGVVEIKIAGEDEDAWQPIDPIGGYPFELRDGCGPNPLSERPAFAFESGGEFIMSTFDLTAFRGRAIQFRFRTGWDCTFCEVAEGWFIDDVRVSTIETCATDLASVRFFRPAFACGDEVTVLLADANFPLSAAYVQLETGAGDFERVDVIDIDSSGRYFGSITINAEPSAVVAEDGILQAFALDTIRMSFLDFDVGGGASRLAEATAAVDCVPPVFGGLQSALKADARVTLAWDSVAETSETSFPIDFRVYRSLTSGGQDFASPLVPSPEASEILEELEPMNTQFIDFDVTNGETYFYVVRAADAVGNEESNVVEFSTRPIGPLDHFILAGIATRQIAAEGIPFAVSARDRDDNLIEDDSSIVQLIALRGPPSAANVKMLGFTGFADAVIDLFPVLDAISRHFTGFEASFVRTLNPVLIQDELAGVDLVLIGPQPDAAPGELAEAAQALGPTLRAFVERGGALIVCSYLGQEHEFITRAGLMQLTPKASIGNRRVTISAEHRLTKDVATPFFASFLHTYSSDDATEVMEIEETGDGIIFVREVGLGRVVMFGSNVISPSLQLVRLIANAVEWARDSGDEPVIAEPQTLNLVNGIALTGLVIAAPADEIHVRIDDLDRHRGQTNAFAVTMPGGVARLEFGRGIYDCGEELQLTLDDAALAGTQIQCVDITAKSGPDGESGDAETICLVERPAGSGVFVGSLPTSGGAIVAQDGTLQAASSIVDIIAIYEGGGSPLVARTVIGCTPLATGVSADVLNYLLGNSFDAADLDLNSDGEVDIADLNMASDILAPGAARLPTPADGQNNVDIRTSLQWLAGERSESFAIKLWAASGPEPEAATFDILGAARVQPPEALDFQTIYRWRAIARNSFGSTAGPVWEFTTALQPPGPVENIFPANGAQGVSLTPSFDWNDSPRAVDYEFYLWRADGPDPVGSAAAGLAQSEYAIMEPRDMPLEPSTTYRWRFVARNETSLFIGTIWDFTTGQAAALRPGARPGEHP